MHETWYFVAMEYYAWVLNRTLLVSVEDRSIIGRNCRGLTAVKGGLGLTRYLSGLFAVYGDAEDPESYIRDQLLDRQAKPRFEYGIADITSVTFPSFKPTPSARNG